MEALSLLVQQLMKNIKSTLKRIKRLSRRFQTIEVKEPSESEYY